MDWVWFLFAFDGRINRAKVWLGLLVILCWMVFIALVMLGIDGMFGNPVKSLHFNVNDIFCLRRSGRPARRDIAACARARRHLPPISC